MKIEILEQKGYKFLWIDEELWMWDIPAEKRIQKKLASQARGDILVVGYGLGVVHQYLEENVNIQSITTVEKYSEIIVANQKVSGRIIGQVLIEDFYDLYAEKRWDCIIGDIWQEIHPSCKTEYVKFKNKAKTLITANGKMLAWGMEYFEWLLTK